MELRIDDTVKIELGETMWRDLPAEVWVGEQRGGQ